jgi:hypothetical protein
LSGPITLVKGKSNATIKIMATEKKSNYGATEASFILECNVGYSGLVFALINKFKGPGKY